MRCCRRQLPAGQFVRSVAFHASTTRRTRSTCAVPQAGEPESEVSEGRAASQLVSAEFRRTAASSSAVGRTAQARHVLRSWTVGSSWASPSASRRPPRPPSCRRPGPAARAARRGPGACPPPSGRAGPACPPAVRPPRCRWPGPAARAAPRGPGACPPPSGRAGPARPPAVRPAQLSVSRASSPSSALAGLALVLRRRVELGQPARQLVRPSQPSVCTGQQPEQRLAGLALVLRRRVERASPPASRAATQLSVSRASSPSSASRAWRLSSAVGSSWASPPASRCGRPAVGLTGQQPEQRVAGLAIRGPPVRCSAEVAEAARPERAPPGLGQSSLQPRATSQPRWTRRLPGRGVPGTATRHR